MTNAEQLQMFEPQGEILASLTVKHLQTSESEHRIAANLMASGLIHAASSRAAIAHKALEQACVCETALQFERLAGLI